LIRIQTGSEGKLPGLGCGSGGRACVPLAKGIDDDPDPPRGWSTLRWASDDVTRSRERPVVLEIRSAGVGSFSCETTPSMCAYGILPDFA
jgi:hypothetical protein